MSYGANDGSQVGPHRVGVFDLATFAPVTTLSDSNSQLRNAQGLATDEVSKIVYVVDGFYGAPDNFTLPASYDETQADIIMRLTYKY